MIALMLNWLKAETMVIHWWIWIYGLITIAGSCVGIMAGLGKFEMFYGDALLQPGAKLPMPDDHEDRGAYVVDGSVEIAGQTFEKGQMMVFRPGDRVSMRAGAQGARVMILGGETLEGSRYIRWNFVASSRERIEEAKEAWRAGDWEHGRFQLPPTDNAEFIPLPNR